MITRQSLALPATSIAMFAAVAAVSLCCATVPVSRVGLIEVRWSPGAERPWPLLEEAIGAMVEQLRISYPGRTWDDVRIDVQPSDGLCLGPYTPSGLAPCRADPKRQCPVNGTISREPGILALSFTPRICVRQIRDAGGGLLPASASAIIHEGCEHIGPWEALGDLNWDHAAKYRRCTAAAEERLGQGGTHE